LATAIAWAMVLLLTGTPFARHFMALHATVLALASALLVVALLRPRTVSPKVMYDAGFLDGRRYERELRASMASVTPLHDGTHGRTPV
jgi:hypothetical protein